MAGGACETKSLMSFKLCIVFTSSFFFYMFRSVVLFFPLWHGFVVSFLIYSQTVATFRKGVRAVQMVGRASTYQNNPKTKNKPKTQTEFFSIFILFSIFCEQNYSILVCRVLSFEYMLFCYVHEFQTQEKFEMYWNHFSNLEISQILFINKFNWLIHRG